MTLSYPPARTGEPGERPARPSGRLHEPPFFPPFPGRNTRKFGVRAVLNLLQRTWTLAQAFFTPGLVVPEAATGGLLAWFLSPRMKTARTRLYHETSGVHGGFPGTGPTPPTCVRFDGAAAAAPRVPSGAYCPFSNQVHGRREGRRTCPYLQPVTLLEAYSGLPCVRSFPDVRCYRYATACLSRCLSRREHARSVSYHRTTSGL